MHRLTIFFGYILLKFSFARHHNSQGIPEFGNPTENWIYSGFLPPFLLATISSLLISQSFSFVSFSPLSPNSAPVLVKFQPMQSLNVDQKFKLFCYLLDGVIGGSDGQPVDTVQFEWAKNGRILHSSSKYRIDMMNDESFLTIEKLSITDTGNYSCTVRNQFGTDVQYTQLTVKGLI